MNQKQLTIHCAALAKAMCVLLGFVTSVAFSYPLDGEADSGIRRLQGYAIAQEQPTGQKLVPGALLNSAQVQLRLVGHDVPEFDSLVEDAAMKRSLQSIFSGRDPSYAVVVVDFADPENIRWAGLRPDTKQNVGSVGKILTMAGLFHALAEAFPDPMDRARILATTSVRAGDWVVGDEHDVPRFDSEAGRNRFARLKPEDEFRLSEWLDHAISASANGAASVIWREAILLHEFGDRYPLSFAESEAFFNNTPKSRLSEISQSIMLAPLQNAGLSTNNIRQGSFWTRTAQNRVPGPNSYATPRELARFMLRLEQGLLVDEWSSLEMKKYLYITKRRYRYVYAPELNSTATFFKSGSLYSCVAEEGFRCGRYLGNARNFMNSVATIEAPAGDPTSATYTVALISNVLRFNSAWDHSRFAAAIHEMMTSSSPVTVREEARAGELSEVTKSD